VLIETPVNLREFHKPICSNREPSHRQVNSLAYFGSNAAQLLKVGCRRKAKIQIPQMCEFRLLHSIDEPAAGAELDQPLEPGSANQPGYASSGR